MPMLDQNHRGKFRLLTDTLNPVTVIQVNWHISKLFLKRTLLLKTSAGICQLSCILMFKRFGCIFSLTAPIYVLYTCSLTYFFLLITSFVELIMIYIGKIYILVSIQESHTFVCETSFMK